jgi:hypothetical protein
MGFRDCIPPAEPATGPRGAVQGTPRRSPPPDTVACPDERQVVTQATAGRWMRPVPQDGRQATSRGTPLHRANWEPTPPPAQAPPQPGTERSLVPKLELDQLTARRQSTGRRIPHPRTTWFPPGRSPETRSFLVGTRHGTPPPNPPFEGWGDLGTPQLSLSSVFRMSDIATAHRTARRQLTQTTAGPAVPPQQKPRTTTVGSRGVGVPRRSSRLQSKAAFPDSPHSHSPTAVFGGVLRYCIPYSNDFVE